MMADHAPAFTHPRESVGRHELALGQDLAAHHDGQPRTADDPFVHATHLGCLRVAKDGAPARHDLGPSVQRRLAGMQADHRTGRRPDPVHCLGVALGESAVERAIGRKHGLALLVVEVRQERRWAGRTAGHSSLETPWLRGLGLADTEGASNCRDDDVHPQTRIPAVPSAARGRSAARRGPCLPQGDAAQGEDRGPLRELEHALIGIQQGDGQEGLDRHHLAQAVWRQRADLPRPLRHYRGAFGQQRTRPEPVPGGFRVNGTKVWTSGAHHNHYCIALVRTSGQHGDRHKGLSQILVDLKTPGITIRPIINLAGRHDWNEVTFNDAFIPESCLIGNEGDGWLQVTSELAFERSGPERFMQNFYILRELVRVLGRQPAKRASAILGRLVARLWTLRQMSVAVAGMMQGGMSPAIEAALVKDLGTIYQQDLPEIARTIAESDATTEDDLADFLDIAQYATMMAPSYTIQGGTTQVLRGIVARGLGLR